MIEIFSAFSKDHLNEIIELFREYADWLDLVMCYRNIVEEIAELPGDYGPPGGNLLLAHVDGETAGCAALCGWKGDVCEMKRLYVRPRFRGMGIGRKLAEEVIEEARRIGYRLMRLDTLPQMNEAIELYKSLGFKQIEKYRASPRDDAQYFELAL